MAFVDNEWVSIPLPTTASMVSIYTEECCVHVCMYVCMYVRTCVHACVCMHVCMHACIYVCVCIHVCVCMCVYMSSYSWLKKLLLVTVWCRPDTDSGNLESREKYVSSYFAQERDRCVQLIIYTKGGLCHQSNSITGAFKGFKTCDSVGVYMRMCGCGWI